MMMESKYFIYEIFHSILISIQDMKYFARYYLFSKRFYT